MPVVRGHISVVQEGRVLLVTEDGRGFVLTLPHSTLIADRELQRLKADAVPVEVEYDGEPSLDTAALRSVREVAAG